MFPNRTKTLHTFFNIFKFNYLFVTVSVTPHPATVQLVPAFGDESGNVIFFIKLVKFPNEGI